MCDFLVNLDFHKVLVYTRYVPYIYIHTRAHTFEFCQSVIAYALLRTEYIILASYLMQTYSKAVTEKKKEASNYSAY